VRKTLGISAHVEPLGKFYYELPRCFLARVPKGPGEPVDELLFGEPHPEDTEACDRVRSLLLGRKKEREEKATRERIAYLDRKLARALTVLRRHQAEYARLKIATKALSRHHPERATMAHAMKIHRTRIGQASTSVERWSAKLFVLGHPRDLALVETS
jgi:hypothetical protein